MKKKKILSVSQSVGQSVSQRRCSRSKIRGLKSRPKKIHSFSLGLYLGLFNSIYASLDALIKGGWVCGIKRLKLPLRHNSCS